MMHEPTEFPSAVQQVDGDTLFPRSWARRCRALVVLLLCFVWNTRACYPAETSNIDSAQEPAASDTGEAQANTNSPWFILPALINVHPKLQSETLVPRYFDPAMRLLAPGFNDVRTIADLRDEYILWTPDFAIGGVLSRHWAAYIHLGYSAGKVRTKAHDNSIFLAPLHTDFEIYRSAAYLGLCADYFPWGMPERREYHSIWDRLRNAKPTLGLRLTETSAGYSAKAKAGFSDVTRPLDLHLKDNWWITTFNANIGADVPIDKSNALSLNAGYNLAFKRGFDFDGAAYTIGWKHYFK